MHPAKKFDTKHQLGIARDSEGINLASLETLDLRGCSSLKEISRSLGKDGEYKKGLLGSY